MIQVEIERSLEEKLAERRRAVRDAIVEEARRHPQLRCEDCLAWLNGLHAWILFHLPRMTAHYASRLARESVQDAARRVGRGEPIGDPPRVPDAVRALWEGSGRIVTTT